MSMFKKPKRNFRGRKANENDSDEESKDAVEPMDDEDTQGTFDSSENSGLQLKKLKKKKKDKSSTAILSFDHEEYDEEKEVFKIKKSSHSRRIAKQLKKESRKEKEEREKREKETEEEDKQVERKDEVSNGKSEEDMDTGDREVREPSPVEDLDEEDQKFKGKGLSSKPNFQSILLSGQIPDAHMIHLARKRRQLAREMGNEFIPIDGNASEENSSSRLIREEDHDHSDDDDDQPIQFTVNTKERDRRIIRDKFLQAEQGSDEGSDHEQLNEWEEQQIRKGVGIPQTSTVTPQDDYMSYQQYMYGQTSNIFNPNAPSFDVGGYSAPAQTQSNMPSSLGVKASPNPPAQLPQITVDEIKKRLTDRMESLASVHRAHRNEKDDIESRLECSDSNITKYEGSIEGLEEQYRFFQEMRGYVRDLVECLNEKVPQVKFLERCWFHLYKQKAEKLVKRRQDDIKDQSMDFMSSKAVAAPNLHGVDSLSNQDSEKQRRVAEREARRSRRRRAREAKGVKDHYEGMSSDDEESKSDIHKFNMERDRLEHDCSTLLDDVVDDFAKISRVMARFETWKHSHNESYEEAFIGLCLPKLFTPIVRLHLIAWNPLQEGCPDFEETNWYETLMFYGFQEDEDIVKEDSDIKLMPSIIEKVLLPKLTDLVEGVWDPMSTGQTNRLVRVLHKLIRNYPTIGADSKNTQALIKAVAYRMRKTLDDDVFMPLYPKQMLENRNSAQFMFFQRQFWMLVKLLGNFLLMNGILADKLLKELSLDGLLNRYMMMALQNSPISHETLHKCNTIISGFPKAWFSDLETESTIPQLGMMCRYLLSAANAIHNNTAGGKESERKEARDCVKQITKMLVTIHALDHAQALADKFSLKI